MASSDNFWILPSDNAFCTKSAVTSAGPIKGAPVTTFLPIIFAVDFIAPSGFAFAAALALVTEESIGFMLTGDLGV